MSRDWSKEKRKYKTRNGTTSIEDEKFHKNYDGVFLAKDKRTYYCRVEFGDKLWYSYNYETQIAAQRALVIMRAALKGKVNDYWKNV